MRRFAAIACLFLCCCAETRIYEPNANGKGSHLVAIVQSDVVKFHYHHGRTEVTADSLNNSAATLAQGTAAQNVLTGVSSVTAATGSAILTSGIKIH